MKRIRFLMVCTLCIATCFLLAYVGVTLCYKMYYPIKYDQAIDKYSKEYDVEKSLVLAVIHAESRFKPEAVSNIGARGLMQITDDTFEWAKWRMDDEQTEYGDLFDPETNIRYGVFILSLLKQEFGSDASALAAYHAGWGSVKKWLGDTQYSSDGVNIQTIPFVDTAWYVPKVLDTKKKYEKLYKEILS